MANRPTIGLLLSAGTMALAIAAAPTAWAAPSDQPCSDMGGSTLCQRTSNAQIYATPQSKADPPKTTYGPFLGYHNGRI